MDNLIMSSLAFIGAVIPIVSILIKLNNTITKLIVTIDNLSEQMTDSKDDRKEIHSILSNHETRLSLLENEK